MKLNIIPREEALQKEVLIIVSREDSGLATSLLENDKEKPYLQKMQDLQKEHIYINRLNQFVHIFFTARGKGGYKLQEAMRKAGHKLYKEIQEYSAVEVAIVSDLHASRVLDFVEGFILSGYRFDRYKAQKKRYQPEHVYIAHPQIGKEKLQELLHVQDAVFHTRDLVNEPLNALNAEELAKRIQVIGSEAGYNTEIFDKRRIEILRMGGLLAVNRGSVDPPTFAVMEWKPENARNKQPYILAGKGVVYDTGGISLKSTKNSMDKMKVDMAGAATVAGTLYALAANNIPVHVIGLVPASDNRPGGNACVPGDVIRMHNGATVEVLNTDAEGRLMLADALSFAQRYDPALVIDVATLTGSAAIALGNQGAVFMGTADNSMKKLLAESGNRTHERLVEFPLWEEYDAMLQSDIADMKNVGGREAGAITAGKFLQRFTNYPWLHIDIAGPAWLPNEDSYRGKGASGIGVRLLYDFFTNPNL